MHTCLPLGFPFSRREMTGGGGGGGLGGLWCSILVILVGIGTGSAARKDHGDNGDFSIPDPPLVEKYRGNMVKPNN